MLTPNTMLQSRYRIVRQIAQGGMGAVYEAVDERLHCTVAVKETRTGNDTRLLAAFEREARLLARLRHPALTVVSDHFVEAGGQFLVMQFIPGNDLGTLLARRGQPFELPQVLTWAHQLIDALDYLHSRTPPIVHRDIKPANLKLTERGEIVLLDFGLARHLAGQTGAPSLVGYTPDYAPLEQIQGNPPDPRSDQYALAATLYHLLTGQAPPSALARASALMQGSPDPLVPASERNPLVPHLVALVLQRAMAPQPTDRFDSIKAFQLALRDAQLKGNTVVVGAGTTTRIAPRRRSLLALFAPWQVAVLASGLVIIVLLTALLVWVLATRPPGPRDQAATAVALPPPNGAGPAGDAAAGQSRAEPLPFGSSVSFGEFTITPAAILRGDDATRAVAQANLFNDPPPEGYEYLVVTLRLTNQTGQPLSESRSLYTEVTGERHILYAAGGAVPPQPWPEEIAAGATVEGQEVVLVPSGERELMLRLSQLGAFDEPSYFIAIDQGAQVQPLDSQPPAISPLGSDANEPAGPGETVTSTYWQATLLEARRGDAARALVRSFSDTNRDPPEGREYVALRVRLRAIATSAPDEPVSLLGQTFAMLDSSGEPLDSQYVAIPEPQINGLAMFAGGEQEGWVILLGDPAVQRPVVQFRPGIAGDRDTRYLLLP